MKTPLSLLLPLVLILSVIAIPTSREKQSQAFALSIPTALAATFSDLRSPTLIKQVEYLSEKGIIKGYPDGTFKPNNVINRAEALKIIFESVGLSVSARSLPAGQAGEATKPALPAGRQSPFPDVPASAWFAPYVAEAKSRGLIKGYADGTYKPDQPVNTVEFIKIAMLAQEYFKEPTSAELSAITTQYSDVSTDQWYAPHVAFALKNNFLLKTKKLNPSKGILRGDAVHIIYQVTKYNETVVVTDPEPTTECTASTCVNGIDIAKEYPEIFSNDLVEVENGKVEIYGEPYTFRISERNLMTSIWSAEKKKAIAETPEAEKVRIVNEEYGGEYQRILEIKGGAGGNHQYLSVPGFIIKVRGGIDASTCGQTTCRLEKMYIYEPNIGYNSKDYGMEFVDFRKTDGGRVLLFDIIQELNYLQKIDELNRQ